MPLRIYGGKDAKSEEYPYIVRLEKQISSNLINHTVITAHRGICTASALSAVWLITCAHCLAGKYPYIIREKEEKGLKYIVINMVIRYGHVKSSPWTKDTFSDVIQTIMHPRYMMKQYVTGSVTFSRNDIGLIKTSPMKLGSYIKISAIDYRAVYGQEAVIGGFGTMRIKNADGALVINSTLNLGKPLQVLKVLITRCHTIFVPAVCLSPRCRSKTSSCPGDSGGPLMHPSGLLGLVVGGTQKCREEIKVAVEAGKATPVSPYIEWIYSNING